MRRADKTYFKTKTQPIPKKKPQPSSSGLLKTVKLKKHTNFFYPVQFMIQFKKKPFVCITNGSTR